MLKVGVTGGIGGGKSIVCNLFNVLGVPVFDADEAGRRLLAEDSGVIEKVATIFGEGVITSGKPDRRKIAEIVFEDKEKLAQLNAVIHPAVREKFAAWAAEQTAPYVIDEAAILFETGIYKQLDFTVLIIAPEELRIKRVMQRDNAIEADTLNRMKNQWSDEKKKALADYILINDDINPLLPQVMEIHNQLIVRNK
jgi:dephospho-CoA kinase